MGFRLHAPLTVCKQLGSVNPVNYPSVQLNTSLDYRTRDYNETCQISCAPGNVPLVFTFILSQILLFLSWYT